MYIHLQRNNNNITQQRIYVLKYIVCVFQDGDTPMHIATLFGHRYIVLEFIELCRYFGCKLNLLIANNVLLMHTCILFMFFFTMLD